MSMEDDSAQGRAKYSAEIAALIESAILPEVSARHGTGAQKPLLPHPEATVEAVAHLALSADLPALERYLRKAAKGPQGIDGLLLDLIPRAARLLGTGWLDDTLSFVDVTLGSGTLTRAVRALSPDFHAGSKPLSVGPRRAVFGAFPGDGHALGSSIAAEFFRREGWDVELANGLGRRALILLVADRRATLLGLSIGTTAAVQELPTFVRDVRLALGSEAPAIYVGGEAVAHSHDAILAAGVDAVIADLPTALSRARALSPHQKVPA